MYHCLHLAQHGIKRNEINNTWITEKCQYAVFFIYQNQEVESRTENTIWNKSHSHYEEQYCRIE